MSETHLTLTADVLSGENSTQTEQLVSIQREGSEYTAIHHPSQTTATHFDPQMAFDRLEAKLHDRATEPLSEREEMCPIGVDDLDGVVHERARVTRTAIDEGYIDAWYEPIPCDTIPPADWLAVSDEIDTISGGDIHRVIAGCVDALLRRQGYRVVTYEDDAHYAAQPGGAKADIAVPHAGIYVEIAGHENGGLSDDLDKIAHCLDFGKHPRLWSPSSPQIAQSPHLFHHPPGNPVDEIVYVPWFDAAVDLGDRMDVTLPVYTFTRTDKELPSSRD